MKVHIFDLHNAPHRLLCDRDLSGTRHDMSSVDNHTGGPAAGELPEQELLLALRAGDIDRATAVLRERREQAVAELSILEVVFPIALSSLAESYDLHGVTGSEGPYFHLARELHRFMPEEEREIPDMLCTFLYAGCKFNQPLFTEWALSLVTRHPGIDLPSLVADRMYELNSLRHSAIYYVAKNGSMELYDMLSRALQQQADEVEPERALSLQQPSASTSPVLLEARIFDRLIATAVTTNSRPAQPTPESVALSSLPAAPSEGAAAASASGANGGREGSGGSASSSSPAGSGINNEGDSGGGSDEEGDGAGGGAVMKRPEAPDPPALYTSLKAGHTAFIRHVLAGLPPPARVRVVRTLVTHALIPLDDVAAAQTLYEVCTGRHDARQAPGDAAATHAAGPQPPLLEPSAALFAFALGRVASNFGGGAAAPDARSRRSSVNSTGQLALSSAGALFTAATDDVGASATAPSSGLSPARPVVLSTGSAGAVTAPAVNTPASSASPAPSVSPSPAPSVSYHALHFCAFVSESSAEAHLVRWPASTRYAQWLLASLPVHALIAPLPRVRWGGVLPLLPDEGSSSSVIGSSGGGSGDVTPVASDAGGSGQVPASSIPTAAGAASTAPSGSSGPSVAIWSGWSPMLSAAAAGAVGLGQAIFAATASVRSSASASAALPGHHRHLHTASEAGSSPVPASCDSSSGDSSPSPPLPPFLDPLSAHATRIASGAAAAAAGKAAPALTTVRPIRVAVESSVGHRRLELVTWLSHLLTPSQLDSQLYAPIGRQLSAAKPDFVKLLCKVAPLSLRAMRQGGVSALGQPSVAGPLGGAGGSSGGGGSRRSSAGTADTSFVSDVDQALALVLGSEQGSMGREGAGGSIGRRARRSHPPLPQAFTQAGAPLPGGDVTASLSRRSRSGTAGAESVASAASSSAVAQSRPSSGRWRRERTGTETSSAAASVHSAGEDGGLNTSFTGERASSSQLSQPQPRRKGSDVSGSSGHPPPAPRRSGGGPAASPAVVALVSGIATSPKRISAPGSNQPAQSSLSLSRGRSASEGSTPLLSPPPPAHRAVAGTPGATGGWRGASRDALNTSFRDDEDDGRERCDSGTGQSSADEGEREGSDADEGGRVRGDARTNGAYAAAAPSPTADEGGGDFQLITRRTRRRAGTGGAAAAVGSGVVNGGSGSGRPAVGGAHASRHGASRQAVPSHQQREGRQPHYHQPNVQSNATAASPLGKARPLSQQFSASVPMASPPASPARSIAPAVTVPQTVSQGPATPARTPLRSQPISLIGAAVQPVLGDSEAGVGGGNGPSGWSAQAVILPSVPTHTPPSPSAALPHIYHQQQTGLFGSESDAHSRQPAYAGASGLYTASPRAQPSQLSHSNRSGVYHMHETGGGAVLPLSLGIGMGDVAPHPSVYAPGAYAHTSSSLLHTPIPALRAGLGSPYLPLHAHLTQQGSSPAGAMGLDAASAAAGCSPSVSLGPLSFPARVDDRQFIAHGPLPGVSLFRGRHGRFGACIMRVDSSALPLPHWFPDVLARLAEESAAFDSTMEQPGEESAGGMSARHQRSDRASHAAHVLRFVGDAMSGPAGLSAAAVVAGGEEASYLAFESVDASLADAIAPEHSSSGESTHAHASAPASPFRVTGHEQSDVSIFYRSEPSLVQRIGWCRQLVAGLAAIHAAGLAHGSLCPATVFVRGSGASVRLGPPALAQSSAQALIELLASAPPESQRHASVRTRLRSLATGLLASLGPWLPMEAHVALARLVDAQGVNAGSAAEALQSAFTPAGDVFALGCTLFAVLARGWHPMAGGSQQPSSSSMSASATSGILAGHAPLEARLRPVTLLQACAAGQVVASPPQSSSAGSLSGPEALPLAAVDAITACLSPLPAHRPSVAALLRHPLFWSRRDAIDALSGFADGMKRKYGVVPAIPHAYLPQLAHGPSSGVGGGAGRPSSGSGVGGSLLAGAPPSTVHPLAGPMIPSQPWVGSPAPELVYLEHAFAWHEGPGSDWAAALATRDQARTGAAAPRVWHTGPAGSAAAAYSGGGDVLSGPAQSTHGSGAMWPGASPLHPPEERKSPENYYWAHRKRGLAAVGILRAVRNIAGAHAGDYVADGTFASLGEVHAYFAEGLPWLLLEVQAAAGLAAP